MWESVVEVSVVWEGVRAEENYDWVKKVVRVEERVWELKRLSETSKWEKRSQLGPTMPHVEGLVTIHKNRVGHVDIKLESIVNGKKGHSWDPHATKKVTAGTHMPHVEGLVTIHKNRVGHVDIKLESMDSSFISTWPKKAWNSDWWDPL